MGNECCVENSIVATSYRDTDIRMDSFPDELSDELREAFIFRSYREYETKKKEVHTRSKHFLHYYIGSKKIRYLKPDKTNETESLKPKMFPIKTLYNAMIKVFEKLNSYNANAYCLPKDELSKIDYNLISNYLSCFVRDNNQKTQKEDIMVSVPKKVTKRINFFTDDFPYKLANLDNLLSNQSIILIGYDRNLRLTFLIKPTNTETKFKSNPNYAVFLIFMIEFLQPALVETLKFSSQINILIDFEQNDVDSELLKMIMTYLNDYYPLKLSKMFIINYKPIDPRRSTFKSIKDEDSSLSLCYVNQSLLLITLKQHFHVAFIPQEYGGDLQIQSPKKKIETINEMLEYFYSSLIPANISTSKNNTFPK